MYDDLKVVLTTSPSPWHPSALPTVRSVMAIWQTLDAVFTPIHFYCDKPSDYITRDERHAYWRYIRALRALDLGPIIVADAWVGLVGLYRMIIEDLDKPVVLNWQHDWTVRAPERINASRIVHCVASDPRVQIVRLAKRWIHPKPIDSYQEPWPEEEFGIPLIATNGWGDSPHFASAEHYREFLLPRLSDYKGPCGRFGVEGPVIKSYRHDINRMGFGAAHAKWGSWLYGRPDEERYILHIGRAAVKWRARRGVPHYNGGFRRPAGLNLLPKATGEQVAYDHECLEQSDRCGVVRPQASQQTEDLRACDTIDPE